MSRSTLGSVADVAAAPTPADEARADAGARRRVSGWAAVVLASIALLAGALALLALLWATSVSTESSSYTAKIPSTLVGIEIAVAEGSVEIVGSATPDVIVERNESWAFGHGPTERRSIVGGVLAIESTCARLVLGRCAADYRISLPETIRATISVTRGDIRINAFRGRVDLSTRSGAIVVEAFCGRIVEAAAHGGDVAVQASCAPQRIAARSDSGDVSIAVPPGTYNVEADSNTGSVDVEGLTELPSATFGIQALSGSGDVSVRAGS